jgi:hypothetical protein
MSRVRDPMTQGHNNPRTQNTRNVPFPGSRRTGDFREKTQSQASMQFKIPASGRLVNSPTNEVSSARRRETKRVQGTLITGSGDHYLSQSVSPKLYNRVSVGTGTGKRRLIPSCSSFSRLNPESFPRFHSVADVHLTTFSHVES